MKTLLTISTLIFSVMFSSTSFAEDAYYRLFVISVMKSPLYVSKDGSVTEKSEFKGITQFETSNLGGGKFSTKEQCLNFLQSLVMQRGGKSRGYSMIRSPFHYQNIMVEDTGDGYHTERHCVLIE
jgi:hypothetical protein